MVRNWLIYMATLIALVIFSVMYIKESGVVVLFMVAIVPLLYSFVTWLAMRKRIRAYFGEEILTIARGEEAKITVLVSNPSKLSCGSVAEICLKIRSGMGQDIEEIRKRVVLEANDTEVIFEYQPRYSGMNEMYVAEVIVYSGFSLLRHRTSSEEILSFLIMPEYKEYPICPDLSSEEREGESDRFSRMKAGNDPSELFDIRLYKPGDKLNRINWKFSAKHNTLMVQDFGFSIACDTAIFFDISKNDDPNRIETLIEMLYYLSVQMVLQGKMFYVIWKDAEQGCAERMLIREEEDIFTLFTKVFQSNHIAIDTTLEDMYEAQYEGEFLAETIFLYTGRQDLQDEIVRGKLHADYLEFVKV
nr:DUF58 domain-containing protein [Eubacterium sp.]